MTTLTQDLPQGNSSNSKSDSEPVIVAEWPINRRENVRVSIELYNGAQLINVRKWFEADNGEKRPSKQGIALGVRHLPQLAEAITKALSIARERGLVADEQ